MSDPPLSKIDFKNKMAWIWTTLDTSHCIKVKSYLYWCNIQEEEEEEEAQPAPKKKKPEEQKKRKAEEDAKESPVKKAKPEKKDKKGIFSRNFIVFDILVQ